MTKFQVNLTANLADLQQDKQFHYARQQLKIAISFLKDILEKPPQLPRSQPQTLWYFDKSIV
jgi:hypothetical protein